MEITKIKLLRVLEILRETDEDHPYTANEIIAKLKLYGLDAERKSVLRDIAALQDNGYDIVLHSDNKRGYFMASREFEDWELKVLMDAAVGASFLTEENSRRLAEKLSALSSGSGRKTLRAVTPLASTVKNGDPTTKNNIDVLLTAIRRKKQVVFQYIYTGPDLKKHLRFDGREYPISPYALIWRNDRYYLVGKYGDYDTLSYYRLERIRNIRVSEKSAVDPERFLGKNADLRIKEFVERNLNNYSGETTAVLLKIEEERIDLLLDTFGPDFRIESRSDGELTVRVTVNDGWGLTAWLLEHGDCVQIIEPAVIREEVIHYLDLIRKKYADMQDSGKE